jgi:hypothetical protein
MKTVAETGHVVDPFPRQRVDLGIHCRADGIKLGLIAWSAA